MHDSYKILETKTYYQHYCYECWHVYYGDVKDVKKPCPRCGETENVNAFFEK
jgi:predicted  nucleic acid-binding Zn-ribbon protein